MEFTFEDGKSAEDGTLKVRFVLLIEMFHIGQVLPLQSGITLDDCHKFETYVCCHMGACTYYVLESDVVLRVVPFCISLDNWLEGQNNLGCVSIANKHLNIASDAANMLEGVFKRSRSLITKLYEYGCVGGVDMEIASCGIFKTSPATYKQLGESIENSLMCLFNGVSTQLMEQFNAPAGQCDICAYRNCNILFFSLGCVTLLGLLRKVSLILVHYDDKMEHVVWFLHICPSTLLEAFVICDQVHEFYRQICIYVTRSHALCAFQVMAEKSMLGKAGQVMDSYFSALESDEPLNYRAFLSSFTLLKMLKDPLIWSNYIYKGISGGLPLRGIIILSKDLLEFKLTIFCGVLRVYDSICLRILDKIAVGGSLKNLLFHLAYNSKFWTRKRGPRQCAAAFYWSFLIFVKSKFVFPGCLGFLLCEVASILKHVVEFLEVICCWSLSQGHGFCKAITIMGLLDMLLIMAQLDLTALSGKHSTNTILESNLEDKVLIEDESIVMNQPQPNVDTCNVITQAASGPRNKTRRPSQRLSWNPGPISISAA